MFPFTYCHSKFAEGEKKSIIFTYISSSEQENARTNPGENARNHQPYKREIVGIN